MFLNDTIRNYLFVFVHLIILFFLTPSKNVSMAGHQGNDSLAPSSNFPQKTVSRLVKTSTKEEAKKILKEAFDQKEKAVILLSNLSESIEIIVFDFDGVMIKEGGHYEKAWSALMVRMFQKRDPDHIFPLTDEDLEEGRKFRESTRGVEFGPRIDQLQKLAIEKGIDPDSLLSDEEYRLFHANYALHFAREDHGEELNGWVYEDSLNFLNFLDEWVPFIPRYVATTNIDIQRLVELLKMRSFFMEVFSHPIRSPAGKKIDKTAIILELIKKHGAQPNQVAFFGDAVSDMKFGKAANVVCIGVANNYEEGEKLIEAKADMIVTGLAPKEKILEGLGLFSGEAPSNNDLPHQNPEEIFENAI